MPVPPEVEAAIDKRSSMSVLGNLNDYVKFQMAEGMGKGDGGGAAAVPAQMAMGFGMAQEMMKGFGAAGSGSPAGAPAPGGPAAGASAAPTVEILSPAQVGEVLGVSEADVVATLEAGDLKGKKLGATWRVTWAALDAYLDFLIPPPTDGTHRWGK